ncbi:MAG: glutamate carboxypeptidase [Bryobacteraceae bacterium]
MTRSPALVAIFVSSLAVMSGQNAVLNRVQLEKQPLLDTLKALVEIESGSADLEGIARIGTLVAERLQAVGGEVESVPAVPNMLRIEGLPERLGNTVVARFRGKGTKRILLLAHMDTVYPRGMLAQQPFRIEGDLAYGLGIADDKHGVALIIHALSVLKALNYDQYGLITVLISPDEEVGSLAERDLITSLGASHDIVFSFEGSTASDSVRLATSGIDIGTLTVKGRAAHAGTAPLDGRNALYEMAHQILQMRDLSDPSKAVKMNWTLASAGSVTNAIPENARAIGDIRADDVKNFDGVENVIRERIQKHLIPDTTVEVKFQRMYPPMPVRPQSFGPAEHAQRIYKEIGGTLKVSEVSTGGGTDAAFAALNTKAPVLEGLGLRNFGSHSNNVEYIYISSIEPHLYLTARLIMDVSEGKLVLP